MAFDKKKYDKEYEEEHYDRIFIRLEESLNNRIQEQAKSKNISKSEYVLQAFFEYYRIDLREREVL